MSLKGKEENNPVVMDHGTPGVCMGERLEELIRDFKFFAALFKHTFYIHVCLNH